MAGLKKATNSNNELENVVSEIESESYRVLDEDFEIAEDGYVHDIPLLAGYTDKDGVLHDTFTFREMNGKDEEAISKADVRSNGAKMMNVLVERCVVAIGTLTKKECGAKWGQIIREMLGGDIDYMAFKIRELSKGKEIEFQHKCPNCGTKLTTIVNTDEFDIKPFRGSFSVDFTLARGFVDGKGEVHKEGTIRLPNGLDREIALPIARTNESKALTLLLTRICKFTDGYPITEGILRDMKLRDRQELEKQNREFVKFGYQYTINVECPACEGEFETVLNGLKNFL